MGKLEYFATGGFFSAFAYLFAGIDELLIAFIVFMVADYITGLLAAAAKRKLSSQTGFKGIAKKIGMIFFVVMAVQLDLITGQGDVMRNAILLFLVGVEGISILENLGELGLPIPKVIKRTLERFAEDADPEEKKDNENKK